ISPLTCFASGAVPRQAGLAPAVDGLAVAVAILFPFESFEDVEAVRITVFGCQSCRMPRAHAAAAQEEHDVFLAGYLFQLRQEFRVGRAARIKIPLHSA